MKKLTFKKKMVIVITLIVLVLAGMAAYIIIEDPFNFKKTEDASGNTVATENTVKEEPVVEDTSIKIVDVNSKTRPYAVVVNNTPVAVKVQTGLNKAYLVYEIPTEGNTSRLMAFYKDINEDFTIGTIRSSRHDFVDYALESNAIFVHFGWSHYAEDDQQAGSINYINGLFDAGFWRNNPEGLASEHTAYTSIEKIKEEIQAKGFNTEADTAEETILLNYSHDDINLSEKTDATAANSVTISYDGHQNVTTFVYDPNTKMYTRQEMGKDCIDHETGEAVTTKNIIVEKLTYSVCDDNYYWDLKTTGSGEGYFITNGYAVPITWSKSSRSSKTIYKYADGTEINVNDGRTYIELQTTNQSTNIE